MYTVVIMTNETAAASQEYRRIFFADHENREEIGFCIWRPDGRTVETALPDLYRLIAGKKTWRAIILLSEQDRDEERFPADDKNPFDFLENRDLDATKVNIPKNPLIYLTQLLGGVPEPEMEYEYVTEEVTAAVWGDNVSEEDKIALTKRVRRYEPKREKYRQAMQQYAQLINAPRYRFVENRPEEVLLLSTRRMKQDVTFNEIENAWHLERETSSSEFTHRNLYPAICRFMVFNTCDEMHSLYPASLFRYWTIVLLLATNRISPSNLQAYKLYRVDVELNHHTLSVEFSRFYERLMAMMEQMDSEEKNIVPMAEEVIKKAPKISKRVEVVFNEDGSRDLFVDTKELGYVSDNPDEHSLWKYGFEKASVALHKLYRSPLRSLDIAAHDARSLSAFDAQDVTVLNRYQRSDLEVELEDTYMDALEARSEIGMNLKKHQDEREVINQQIHHRIRERLTGASLGKGMAIGLGAFALGLLPYVVMSGIVSGVNLVWALIILLAALGVGGLFAFAELLIQRKEMQDAIGDHNRLMDGILTEFRDAAASYGDYLSSVSTYQRGKSYLDHEARLRSGKYDSNVQRRVHRKTIRRFAQVAEKWITALGAALDKAYSSANKYSFDISVNPKENEAYSMKGYTLPKQVPLNRTGDLLESPVDFVDSLILVREELFDREVKEEPMSDALMDTLLDEVIEEEAINDADFD